MKLISFDIGIKNMAYCVFDISNNIPYVSSWDVINLINKEDTRAKCNCYLKKGNKICNKNALYYKDNNYYCKTHSSQSGLKIPEKEIKIPKSISVQKLKEIYIKEKIKYDEKNKKEINIEVLREYYDKNYLKIIKKEKNKSSNDYDLIELGRLIKEKFNEIEDFNDITNVIIENQISPIASRMKTIQGMVAQYFIMRFERINIEFISSCNKLKYFTTDKTDYKQHKKDSIYFTNLLLENNEYYTKYVEDFNKNKKKDDLADAFLQGIWYIKFKNNSEINIIIRRT
jgi:hypothetical protein